jgi:hypothetical protein
LNNFKKVTKPRLYYDKYKYKSSISYPDCNLIRYAKTEKDLDKSIALRESYGRSSFYGSVIDKDFLLKLINWRNDVSETDSMVRVDYNCISTYSNNLEVVQSLEKLVPNGVSYAEVKIEGKVGVLLRNNPKHNYRTHFRSKTVPDGFHKEIENFLKQYKNSAFPTPSLLKWLELKGSYTWRQRYLESCFFIDYDDESFLSILSLNFGSYLGKTFKVEQRD